MATERGLELAKRLWGFEPHSPGQREWMLCNAKVKVGACGRRWGKSESTGVDIVLYALEHPNTVQFIIAPTDDQTGIIMQIVSERLHAVPGLDKCITERFAPYHTIKFKDGKGLKRPTTITARTAGPKGKGLRGHKAHRVIVDERAFVPEEVMDKVVTPLLADYDGELVEISTPDGRNGFHRDFLLGQDLTQSRYRSFQFPTSSNPYIPREYLEYEEKHRPAAVWQQEYLAQFLEGEGLVFRRVLEAAVEPLGIAPYRGQFVMGVDWGRTTDFTVLTVIDVARRAVVDIDRFTGVGWELQRGRLVAMILKWSVESALAEYNSIGGPNIERLQAEGWPIQAWTATNATKTALIERLALDIENGPLTYPDDPVLLAELQAYAFDKLPSGLIRYGAPKGMHDDTVISLGLANLAASDPTPGMAAGEERDWGRVVTGGIPSMMPGGVASGAGSITAGLRLGV